MGLGLAIIAYSLGAASGTRGSGRIVESREVTEKEKKEYEKYVKNGGDMSVLQWIRQKEIDGKW